LLAAASVFPLVEPDEMLGRSEERAREPGKYHQELLADTGAEVNNFQQRALVVFDRLVSRITGTSSEKPTSAQLAYRRLIADAYPSVALHSVRVTEIGNALAAYIGAAFALQQAPWDRYLSGDRRAITAEQKRGALVFYGKGRCATCHSGSEFSDFGFHGLAIPQYSIGKHGAFLDYGRGAATSRGIDRFKFRTPPLRNVTLTGPWGHNGTFTTLTQVIEHHFNPVPALHRAQVSHPESAQHAGRLLAQRSPILGEIAPLAPGDVSDLIAFLDALTSSPVMSDDEALPKTVPSGDLQFVRR
jgi:cytochrome c peroxidase